MTFSYDPTLEAPLDRIRFLVGDTIEATARAQDEEIEALYLQTNDENETALALLDSLIARYATMVDKTVGPLSMSYSQAADNLIKIRATISSGSSLATSPRPFAMLRAAPIFSTRRPEVNESYPATRASGIY